MQATSNMVSTIVSNNLEQDDKKEGEEESEREEGTVIELTPIDDYMVAMEPLQFGMTHTHTLLLLNSLLFFLRYF